MVRNMVSNRRLKRLPVKRLLVLLVAALLAMNIAGCAEKTARSPKDIVKEMISCYVPGDRASEDKVNACLKELRSADRKQEKLWRSIMDYWDYVNCGMEVNTDRLPENLPTDSSLGIVVLGFELNSDGTMKDELLSRLKTALACAVQYPEAYVICTGGGTASKNREATEAGMMARWLAENGVDEKRIIVEDRSLSTVENALFSCRILREDYPQIDSVAIVSSSYHIAWGSVLFEAAFLKEASENGGGGIHVVSNAACLIENDRFSDALRFEKSGLLQLASMGG